MPLWRVELRTSYVDSKGQEHTYEDRDGYVSAQTEEVDADTEEDARAIALARAALPDLRVVGIERI